MNEYIKLSMKEFGLKPLHYAVLPGYSFDCWLRSSGVTLDKLQNKQLQDDFVEVKKGSICAIMGDRFINGETWTKSRSNNNSISKNNTNSDSIGNSNNSNNRALGYMTAKNLYGYSMMQKLPYKDFEYYNISLDPRSGFLDILLNTPDDSDHCYYIVCDINYTNSCKKDRATSTNAQ